jgi:hypothetical protein
MQTKTKLISKILASTILFSALAPQESQIAQEALLSRFLLRRPCVNTGIGNWDRRREDVSVNKAVYTSRFFMGPGDRSASMTCRLQPNEAGVIFQNLKLSFGMRDNDLRSPGATVNLYIDGVQTQSQSVTPGGRAGSMLQDVTNARNVAIEVICSNQSQYCDRVYFWEAELEYPPLPPQQ